MTVERIFETVQKAADQLQQTLVADCAAEIAEDIHICSATVTSRLVQLPKILARPTAFSEFKPRE